MKNWRLYLLLFLLYSLITVLIFNHRVINISTHYGMSGVDTDGTFWYQWISNHAKVSNVYIDFNDYLSFPYGYDVSYIPFSSVIYDIQIALVGFLGNTLRNIVFVSNISMLLAYPLSAVAMWALSMYFTKNRFASFVSGLVFSFSYYHILMGRGSLSTNHFYFMPLYFLSLFYYLDHKTLARFTISAAMLAITFWANAYWAFFCGLLSLPIFFMYKRPSFKMGLRNLFVYFIPTVIIVVFLNMNFFFQQSYNFINSTRLDAGRVTNSTKELTSILEIVSPGAHSFFYKYIPTGEGFFLGYLALVLGFSGLFYVKRHKELYYMLLVLFIISVTLQVNTPIGGTLNELYFTLFGFFRAVSRFTALSSMFLGLMIAVCLNELPTLVNKGTLTRFIILFGISIVILLENLNVDPTWKRLTPILPLEAHYSVVKGDPKIESLVGYPANLSNGKSGFPPNQQLLAQIVHNKKIVGGASPFQKEVLDYSRSIGELSNPNIVTVLEKHNVDALMVSYSFVDPQVTNNLRQNKRLTYAGRFEYEANRSYSYDLYYININYYSDNVESNLQLTKTLIEEVYYQGSSGKSLKKVTYNYPYSNDIVLYRKTFSDWVPQFFYLFKSPESILSHNRNSDYNNEWILPVYLESSVQYTPLYRPYLIQQFGLFLRSFVLLLLMFFYVIDLRKEKSGILSKNLISKRV
jgi:hypothetical protein